MQQNAANADKLFFTSLCKPANNRNTAKFFIVLAQNNKIFYRFIKKPNLIILLNMLLVMSVSVVKYNRAGLYLLINFFRKANANAKIKKILASLT